MKRCALVLLTAMSCVLPRVACADVPYWQYRYAFEPFARAIVVDPTNANVLYVAASNAATTYGDYGILQGIGVFRSTDGGHAFAPRSAGLANGLVTSLAIDPADPNVLYAGLLGAGVYKTTNAGATWVPASAGLTSMDVLGLAVDAATPSTIYAGCRTGGVFRSLDGGTSWSMSGGTPGLTAWGFAIDPTNASIVYAATEGGVMKSTNGGATFAPTGLITIPSADGPHNVGDVRAVVVDANDPSVLLAGTVLGGGVFRSTDAGATWTHASVGLQSEYGNWRFMTTILQDPTTPGVFYASSSRDTYRSHDGGLSWAVFDTGLSRGEVYALAADTASGAVWAGSVFGELHRLQVRPSGVNHFRCFQARGKEYAPHLITVADRFGTTTITTGRPVRYCTPTDPMGEGMVDSTAHLVCYKIGKGTFTRQQIGFLSQRIDGYRAYQALRPDSVCVPATVNGVPPAAPRDSYRCVAGPHWKSDAEDFTLSDAFGSQTITDNALYSLCAPTDLTGAGESRLEPDVDLRCDMTKRRHLPFAPASVTTTDQFGTQTLTLVRPDTHCFPALESRD
jgi:hypothetical protein